MSFSTKKNSFNILFELVQKGYDNKVFILDKLESFFGVGKVSITYYKDCWRYRINGLSQTKVIMNYFDNYSFLTKKYNSYLIWKIIHKKIQNNEHLDRVERQKLINLSKTVNMYSERLGKSEDSS